MSILTRNRKARTSNRAATEPRPRRRGAWRNGWRSGWRTTPTDESARSAAESAAELAAVVGPSAVDIAPRRLNLGDGYAAVTAMTGYPPELSLAWPDILLSWPGRLDFAQHIEPIPAATAARRLRTQRARLESARRLDFDKGRLGDPATDAAAEDAADLADRVARGSARLFRAGHYLCVHAPTEDELREAVAEVRAAAASVLLDTQPATWRQMQGWTSTLPLGVDSLRMRRVFDTDALAAAFPLASADLPAPLPGDGIPPGGVLYGLNTASNGVVWWNRWAQENHNSVVLARSGAGKSYLVKCEVLRSLYDRIQVSIIDPEDEYLGLADAVGGTAIQLGAPGIRINPLDIPPGDRRPDALTRRALFLHTLVAVLLGEQPPPSERAALDKAITATYAAAGITNDPTTWTAPAPLLRDLTDTLEAAAKSAADRASSTLAARLSPWTTGSFKSLFDGPTTLRPRGHLVVWSTRQLADELRAPGMLLALDAIWRDVDVPTNTRPDGTTPGPGVGFGAGLGARRLVVVDEAWTLLKDGEGAKFLYRLAKAARKRRAGVAVVTQDAADLLGSDLGQAVIANAATQILMRQAPQAIDRITATFALTGGEARMLLAAGRGQALLLAGSHRVAFQTVASAREHQLAA
ncbi:VirB4 family type IV secretion system protein, partial [Virgisporangium aurantiacum]|uniref:VirB4 family type IV secretion system protein n=1 Tax=Virgisporangium aurantiacum TaxID=175570 RepID=UPI001EF18420